MLEHDAAEGGIPHTESTADLRESPGRGFLRRVERQGGDDVRSRFAAGPIGLVFRHGHLEDVVKVNVFITDMARFGEMNEAYLEFFPKEPPARITVGCAALALGAFVEIDCVAYKP